MEEVVEELGAGEAVADSEAEGGAKKIVIVAGPC